MKTRKLIHIRTESDDTITPALRINTSIKRSFLQKYVICVKYDRRNKFAL